MPAERSTGYQKMAPDIDRLKSSIASYLTSQNLPPTTVWLDNCVASLSATQLAGHLIVLQRTVQFRLLTTDITQSTKPISTTNTFPEDVTNPAVKGRQLSGPITVQILDLEDIGRSRWSQVEELEAQERGEMTRGREVIRVVDEEIDEAAPPQQVNSGRGGPHKLLLQDAKGTKVYAFESSSIDKLQSSEIGAKMVLTDFTVARGLVLLEPKAVQVLGGKVEAWDKKARAEKKEDLKRKAGLG